jgi:hypothetical protein
MRAILRMGAAAPVDVAVKVDHYPIARSIRRVANV